MCVVFVIFYWFVVIDRFVVLRVVWLLTTNRRGRSWFRRWGLGKCLPVKFYCFTHWNFISCFYCENFFRLDKFFTLFWWWGVIRRAVGTLCTSADFFFFMEGKVAVTTSRRALTMILSMTRLLTRFAPHRIWTILTDIYWSQWDFNFVW